VALQGLRLATGFLLIGPYYPTYAHVTVLCPAHHHLPSSHYLGDARYAA